MSLVRPYYIINDLKADTITSMVKANVSKSTVIDSDNSTSYVDLKDVVEAHRPVVIPKEKVSEMLPWVQHFHYLWRAEAVM